MSHIDPDSRLSPGSLPLPAGWRASGVVDLRSVDLGWEQPSVPPAVLIAYDVESFDVEAFARLDVAMPASIGRSVRKRQAEFLMGRLAAREAVRASMMGLGEPGSPMNRLLQGPGRFTGEIAVGEMRQPVWPEGMIGSITHAARYAAAVAVRSMDGVTGIGIDIEHRIAAETLASVEGTAVDATEQALLRHLAGDLPYGLLLTIAFSAKESFFKACSATVGSYFDFDAVALTALDVAGGKLELMLTRSLATSLPQGRRLTVHCQRLDTDTVLTSLAW